MHANISELISIRDRRPVDAAVVEHVGACEQCSARVRELAQIRAELNALPLEPVPPNAWTKIVEKQSAERAGRSIRPKRAALWLVAAIGLAVIALEIAMRFEPFAPAHSLTETNGAPSEAVAVASLQQQSRELEYLLQRYRMPAVMTLRTASAYSELEDSIALIDYRLNAPEIGESEKRSLWQQRVELMETLVTVRATERYADSI